MRKPGFHAQYYYKYLEIPILIIYFKVLHLEKQILVYNIHHDSIAIHSLSVNQLLNGQVAGLFTILDIFTGIGNTTNTFIGVESGEMYLGSHEVVGNGYIHAENSQMAHIGAIISPIYHTEH